MTAQEQILEVRLRATMRQVADTTAVPPLPAKIRQELQDTADPPTVTPLLVLLKTTPVHTGRIRRGRTSLIFSVAAAVAVILAAAVAAAALASGASHRDPATDWNTASPGYSTQYLLGPSSLPGFELGSASLTPTMQQFQFDAAGATFIDRTFSIDTFTMSPAILAQLADMTPVRVGATRGYFGTSSVTGRSVLQTLLGATPRAKYTGVKPPSESAVVWLLDGTHWAALSGVHGLDTDGQPRTVFTQSELVHYAASVRPAGYDHAAPVKLGYVPAGLRFAAALAQPGTHAKASQLIPAGSIDPTNQVASVDGTLGTSAYCLTFSGAATGKTADPRLAPLTVQVVNGAIREMASASQSNPPSLLFPPPWKRTTIGGHLVLESPRDVIIQWGTAQIEILTPRNVADHAVGLVSETDLIKVARALIVPDQAGFVNGFPLLTALPANAF